MGSSDTRTWRTPSAQIVNVDKEKGAVRIQFSVNNLSDWNSATHMISREWNPLFDKPFGAAVSQEFT